MIDEKDLKWEAYYPDAQVGGMNPCHTRTGVRVTHLPSGVAVAVADERSLHKNKTVALAALQLALHAAERR